MRLQRLTIIRMQYHRPVSQKESERANLLRVLFLTFIYFLFLFPVSIPGVPVGTAFIALGMMVAYTVVYSNMQAFSFGKSRTSKILKSYLWWTIFLILYVSVLQQLNGIIDGSSPIGEYINMLVMLPVFYVTGKYIVNNLKELMLVLYLCGVIQAIIIVVARFSPIINIGLLLLFPEGAFESDTRGGVEQLVMEGYSVGFGVITSAGCLRVAIAQIGSLYFLIHSKGGKQIFHLILYLLITIATSLLARTGLLISVIGLLCVVWLKMKQGGGRAPKFILLILTVVVVGIIIINLFFTIDFLEEIFQRFVFLFENGVHDSYFRGYLGEGGDNTIPPISPETIIGLGITYGTSGNGISTITDGGFMRNYSAMGLIVAIINYVLIFNYFRMSYNYSRNLNNKALILFMSSIFLIGEFKETFIYYIFSMCFILLVFNLIERDDIECDVEH